MTVSFRGHGCGQRGRFNEMGSYKDVWLEGNDLLYVDVMTLSISLRSNSAQFVRVECCIMERQRKI